MEKSDVWVYKCVLSRGCGGMVTGVREEEINMGHSLIVICLLESFKME